MEEEGRDEGRGKTENDYPQSADSAPKGQKLIA